MAKLQLVVQADLDHFPHQFVLGCRAPAPGLCGIIDVGLCFAHYVKSHGDGNFLAVVKSVKQIDALDSAIGAMIEVPADDFVFVHPLFFLDGVVKNQAGIVGFDAPDRWLDQPPEVL
jgi:hypothetical protein